MDTRTLLATIVAAPIVVLLVTFLFCGFTACLWSGHLSQEERE